jgi:eukaryotic-like serine/threonine-protein kinase
MLDHASRSRHHARPYEILSPVGSGGMGEVYRARGSGLDRSVAIKILPHQLSADSSAKLRFEREAKTVCALDHPNICSLFDVGSQDATDFLVMEYLEGESLAQRIAKNTLPNRSSPENRRGNRRRPRQTHRSGVVHRDLETGNIMLTEAGAKLLDTAYAQTSSTSSSHSGRVLLVGAYKGKPGGYSSIPAAVNDATPRPEAGMS